MLRQDCDGWKRLVWGAVHNLTNDEEFAAIAWGLVSKQLGTGSTHASEVCRYFNLDGFAYVEPGDRIPRLTPKPKEGASA